MISKLVYSDSHDELAKAAGAMWTLIECDRHIKQAASSAVSEKLIRDNKPDKDHWMAHLIAMGAQETYGQNKNADGFPRAGLKRRHATFVTNGHLFREHNNRDPKHKIGDVKASAFNADMDRVELIVHGCKKKAEKEYEKAKSGKPLDFSMSCKVAYDRCTICDNKAKSPKKYCEHLKYSMNQYLPKFKKFAFAINDDPTFFDISAVENPADRIARHLEIDLGMDKAASVNGVIGGAMLAEMEGLSEACSGFSDIVKQSMLTKLAAAEALVQDFVDGKIDSSARSEFFKQAVTRAFEPEDVTEDEMSVLRNTHPDTLFGGLAKRAACLPFDAFASYVTGEKLVDVRNSPVFKQARQLLPTVFRDLQSSTISATLEDMFDPDFVKGACHSTDVVDRILDTIAGRHSVEPRQAQVRIMRITVNRGMDAAPCMKCASVVNATQESKNLARAYGVYKVAFCVAAEQAAGKDFIDDPVQLLVSYQHLI